MIHCRLSSKPAVLKHLIHMLAELRTQSSGGELYNSLSGVSDPARSNLNESRSEAPSTGSAAFYAARTEALSQSTVNSSTTSDKGSKMTTPRRSPRHLHQNIKTSVQLPRRSPRPNKLAVSKKLQFHGMLTRSKEKLTT